MPSTNNGNGSDTGLARAAWLGMLPESNTYVVHPRLDREDHNEQAASHAQLRSGLPKEYIITPKPEAGDAGLHMLQDVHSLSGPMSPFGKREMEVVRTRPKRLHGGMALAAGAGTTGAVLVRMDSDKGDLLAQQSLSPASPFWIEENHKLKLLDGMPGFYHSSINLADFSAGGPSDQIDLQVLGANDAPLRNVTIKLTICTLTYMTATTDGNGMTSITIPRAAMDLINAVLLEPEGMHWPRMIPNPAFQPGPRNVMRVYGFKEFDPMFYAKGALSWGVQQLLSGRAARLDGAGCKIGVIDTGCDASHGLLQHVVNGSDLTQGGSANGWRDDQIGHGTHVCGVIGARGSIDMLPLRGMAPGAEIHVYKVYPGYDTFTLGYAIEAAVADGMDVINISMGAVPSSDIARNLHTARMLGVACVAAAGNSGGEVMFPAQLNSTLAISALGHSDMIPPDSLSASTRHHSGHSNGNIVGGSTAGYFSPSFTSFGNTIDFTSPGVGIVSTYPRQGLKALDGTSMAAPHVAGLLALYLAHHGALAKLSRSAARLDLLCTLVSQRSVALPFGPDRVGHGMPLAPETAASAGMMRVPPHMPNPGTPSPVA